MTTINWASAVSGNFTDPTKWTGGAVPGAGNDAAITASGSYTVTDNGAASVNSLTSVSGVTVNVKSGMFGIGAGTSTIGGTFEATNTGSFAISSATLTNTGTIKAGDTGASSISSPSITNSGTISETGGGTLTLIGEANGSPYSGIITNSSTGKITASGTNSLVALSNGITLSGGTLTGTSGGSFVVLDAAALDGETHALTINGALAINDTSAGYALLGMSGSIVNKSTITLENNGDGNFAELAVNNNNAFGYIASGMVTLTGGGSIIMEDNSAGASARITSISPSNRAAVTLTNVNNTISGAGNIGLYGNSGGNTASFTLDNQAAGTIDANQTHALVIGVTTLTNEGILEATGGGTLTLSGQTNGLPYSGIVVNSSTSNITASGTNSLVALSTGTTLSGGTLTGTSGGSFVVLDAAALDGETHALTINGALAINDTSAGYALLGMSGSIVNKSTITLENNGDGNFAELAVNNNNAFGYTASGMVTLTGGGSIIMEDNSAGASARITSVSPSNRAAVTLTNVNNTISGAGNIGLYGNSGGNTASFTLDNRAAGTIDANQTHALVIGVTTLTNEGILEATAGGTLNLSGGIIQNSAAGQILASGTNSIVTLSGYTILSGGPLNASGGGSFLVPDAAALDGETSAVTLNGSLAIADSSSNSALLGISGSIINNGTITLENNGDSNFAELAVNNNNFFNYAASGAVTLTGGGSIIMEDNAAGASAIITSVSPSNRAAVTLTNVNNTISGAGHIGLYGNSNGNTASFTLDNQAAGTISANQAHTLDIDVTTLTNEGVIQATGSGGLTIEASNVANTGTITANGGNVVVNAAVTGAGSAAIGGSSILEFTSTSTANTTFITGSSSTLQLDNSAGFTGSISGFGASNVLDLRDFSSSGASVSYNSGTGLLTVTNASASVSYHMALVGVSAFQVIDDGHGGTFVISA